MIIQNILFINIYLGIYSNKLYELCPGVKNKKHMKNSKSHNKEITASISIRLNTKNYKQHDKTQTIS